MPIGEALNNFFLMDWMSWYHDEFENEREKKRIEVKAFEFYWLKTVLHEIQSEIYIRDFHH